MMTAEPPADTRTRRKNAPERSVYGLMQGNSDDFDAFYAGSVRRVTGYRGNSAGHRLTLRS